MIPGSHYGWRPNERNISRTSHICSRAISSIARTTHASPVSCPSASRRTMCRDCSLTRNSALAIRISSEVPTSIPSAAPLRRCVASRSNWITVRRLHSTAQTAGPYGLPVSRRLVAEARATMHPQFGGYLTQWKRQTPTMMPSNAASSGSIESTKAVHFRNASLASMMGWLSDRLRRLQVRAMCQGVFDQGLRSGVFDQGVFNDADRHGHLNAEMPNRGAVCQ